MSYYKTNDQAVLNAVKRHRDERNAIHAAGKQFAETFGGKAVVTRSATSIEFSGVKFTPKKETTIWTMPDEHGRQRPRAKAGKGATPTDKEELKRISQLWNQDFPRQRADLDVLYDALGTNWGELFFSDGIGYFEGADGYFYVETSVKLGPQMTEIIGSEYMLAKEATAQVEA